jgi:hypothetical protein
VQEAKYEQLHKLLLAKFADVHMARVAVSTATCASVVLQLLKGSRHHDSMEHWITHELADSLIQLHSTTEVVLSWQQDISKACLMTVSVAASNTAAAVQVPLLRATGAVIMHTKFGSSAPEAALAVPIQAFIDALDKEGVVVTYTAHQLMEVGQQDARANVMRCKWSQQHVQKYTYSTEREAYIGPSRQKVHVMQVRLAHMDVELQDAVRQAVAPAGAAAAADGS